MTNRLPAPFASDAAIAEAACQRARAATMTALGLGEISFPDETSNSPARFKAAIADAFDMVAELAPRAATVAAGAGLVFGVVTWTNKVAAFEPSYSLEVVDTFGEAAIADQGLTADDCRAAAVRTYYTRAVVSAACVR